MSPVLLVAALVLAEPASPSLGLAAGTAIGLSLHAPLTERAFVQLLGGRAIAGDEAGFVAAIDVGLFLPAILPTGALRIEPYAALGFRGELGGDEPPELLLRLPFGLRFASADLTAELFVEAAPAVPLPGGSDRVRLDALGGVRMRL